MAGRTTRSSPSRRPKPIESLPEATPGFSCGDMSCMLDIKTSIIYSPSWELKMLSAILHRKRKAAKDIAAAARTVEEHRQVYGIRLLVRGLLWLSIYLLSHGL